MKLKIRISEELNELIKKHLNVDFNSYEIFYIDDMILGIQYFILRKNFDFLGVRIKNCKILDVYILVPYSFSITKNPSVFSEVKGFPFACSNSIRFDPYYSVVDLINSDSHMEIASFSDDSFLKVEEFEVLITLYGYSKVQEECDELITDEVINEIYNFFKIKNPYLDGKEWFFLEIKISKKLDKKVKDFLNVNFIDYEVFYAFSSFPDAMYFVLKNENNNFIGVELRNNKVREICTLNLYSTNSVYYDLVNYFCKIDEVVFVNNERMIVHNAREKKLYYVQDDREKNYERFTDDSFLEVNEFLIFLKLYEFDNFKKEVNSKIDNNFMRSLKLHD